MKYRKLGKTGLKASVLGFGAMGLPLKSNNPEDVDVKHTKQMIDYSVNNGINMFDTAFLYHTSNRSKQGVSERIIGECLKEYKDEVHISTKMPSWNIISYEYFDKTLNNQLESLQRDSIELFFIHSIKDSYYLKIREIGLYDFIEKALNDGRIEHVGFSTHGSIQLLDQILSDYDGWEFALTQINYLDNEENPGLIGLKKLNKFNIGTMIMEPLRGGQLAQNQPPQIQNLFDNSNREYTNIEWAFNYLWDKKEVNCVLSGMNDINQVKENVRLAEQSDINMLSDDDRKFLENVKHEYEKLNNIPCTSCNYCMPCPFGVDIPKCFKEYNLDIISGNDNESVQYKYHLHEDKKAHNCTDCGKCIINCPQNIIIPNELKKVAEHFK